MLLEEFGRHRLGREFPGRGFAAALANLDEMRFRGLCPRTADAGESAGFVLFEESSDASQQGFLAQQHAGKLAQGGPTGRYPAIRLDCHAAVAGKPDVTDPHIRGRPASSLATAMRAWRVAPLRTPAGAPW